MGAAAEDLDLRQRQRGTPRRRPDGATAADPRAAAAACAAAIDTAIVALPPRRRLSGRAVELDQARVERRLVEGIEPDQRRCDERRSRWPRRASRRGRRTPRRRRAGRAPRRAPVEAPAGAMARPTGPARELRARPRRWACPGCPRPAGRCTRRDRGRTHTPSSTAQASRNDASGLGRCQQEGAGDAAHALLVEHRR